MPPSTLYLEQPLPRAATLATDVSPLDASLPLLIDESDATLDAFPSARRCGYRGVSSKSCKGFYKSLLNAARCAQANAVPGPRAFLSGEDLTAQAGLAVQQDLALVGLLGLTHVERNGHHYVDGFAGQGAGAAEQQAFLAAHPDLYRDDGGNVRLAIRDGMIDLELARRARLRLARRARLDVVDAAVRGAAGRIRGCAMNDATPPSPGD